MINMLVLFNQKHRLSSESGAWGSSPGPSGAARLHALALRLPPPPPPSAAAAAARLLVVASPAADADRFVAVEGLLLLEQQEDIEQLEQRVQRAWSSKPCCLPSAAGAADAAGAVGAVQAAAGSTWRVSCACRADLEGSTRGVCRLVVGRAWKCRAMRNSCRRTAHARRTRCGAGAGSAGGGRSNRSASGVAVTVRTCVAWPRLSLGRLDVGGGVGGWTLSFRHRLSAN